MQQKYFTLDTKFCFTLETEGDTIKIGDDIMNIKEFGIYFIKLRERSGYESQRQLAEASGVSHSTINRLESGTNKTSSENLKILAKYLRDITPNELLEKAGYIDLPTNNTNQEIDTSSRGYYGGGDDWTEEEIEMADAFIKTIRERKKAEKLKKQGD